MGIIVHALILGSNNEVVWILKTIKIHTQ